MGQETAAAAAAQTKGFFFEEKNWGQGPLLEESARWVILLFKGILTNFVFAEICLKFLIFKGSDNL